MTNSLHTDEILNNEGTDLSGLRWARPGREIAVSAELDGVRPEPPNRLERRKKRTRMALIRAAQTVIAAGKLNAPVLEITQAAAARYRRAR